MHETRDDDDRPRFRRARFASMATRGVFASMSARGLPLEARGPGGLSGSRGSGRS